MMLITPKQGETAKGNTWRVESIPNTGIQVAFRRSRSHFVFRISYLVDVPCKGDTRYETGFTRYEIQDTRYEIRDGLTPLPIPSAPLENTLAELKIEQGKLGFYPKLV